MKSLIIKRLIIANSLSATINSIVCIMLIDGSSMYNITLNISVAILNILAIILLIINNKNKDTSY